MKQISVQQITETVRRLCIEANVLLPDDVRRALDNAAKNEKGDTARGVLADIIENYRRAEALENAESTVSTIVGRIVSGNR